MPRPDLHLDGASIMPMLKGKRKPIHEALYWHFPHYGNLGSGPCSSIRSGNWKLIEWLENGDVELFDLANDESETKNLAASNPQKAEEMLRKLSDWRVEVGANMLREGTDETIREFRSRRMNEL
jgi:arylsulfatase A-like enzyme